MAQVSVLGGEKPGQWLTVIDENEPIVGAYVEPYMGADPKLTIFWKGRIDAGAFVDFCKRVTEATPARDDVVELQGWAFAAGKAQEFSGPEWLSTAEAGSSQFLRFERRMIKPAEAAEFILWGRYIDSSDTEDGEDENIGIQLRKHQMPGLNLPLVYLITATQLGEPGDGTVHRALRMLSEYLI